MSPVVLVSGLIALVFTLALLSYLVTDNPFYRIAAHLFIGLTSGYAVMLTWYNVIWPSLINVVRLGSLINNEPEAGLTLTVTLVAGVLGGIGGVLLLLKTTQVIPRVGGLVVAFMLGVGAAVAVGGAITGTLIPQTSATMVNLLPLSAGDNFLEVAIEGVFTVIGALVTLGFFWYGGKAEPGNPVERSPLIRPVAAVGQIFIAITFGVMYAGALAASVAIFATSVATMKGYFGL